MNQLKNFVNHPLIEHKMALLRDHQTQNNSFRTLVKEITQLLVFPAT
jgi:uracil phosphoribosyltransferase